jgi:uncharacterized membrane protein
MEFKMIIFWVLLLVFVAPGFFFGFKKLVASEDKIVHFQRLGIGKFWMQVLGAAEILADVALFFPVSRLAGMGAWLIILLGANYYNITKKEPKEELYASAGVLALLAVLYFIQP